MSTTKNGAEAASDMFSQAAKMFQAAMEAGAKIQEESAKSLTDLIGGFGKPQQWQMQAQKAMEKGITAARQNVDEAMKIMQENSKTSLELLERAFDAHQIDGRSDVQTRTREMWETAIGSLRRNTEVIVQANSRLLQSWQEMARIFGDNQAETKPE